MAVLGAGIMGCCVALELARHGIRVVVFDQAPAPMSGASRWNEGKIHLGHLYSASGSTATARRLLPGGLMFKPLLEELIETRLDPWTTSHDEVYLFHRDSVVSAETSIAYMQAVHELAAAHPDADRYLAPIQAAPPRPLAAREIGGLADDRMIAGGMRVPERSVCTASVADAVVRRLAGDPGIETIMERRVEGARHREAGGRSAWQVDCGSESFGPFDAVVNALWQGRPLLDAAVLGQSDGEPNHRYRVAAFVQSDAAPGHASAVIAVGPFGDVKSYGNGRFYLSWYADGLLAEGSSTAPPAVPALDGPARVALATRIAGSIARVLPGTAEIFRRARHVAVEGGWVYARGGGALSDAASSLHRRDRIGIARDGTYLSIDTGKYSMAPMLARQASEMLLDSLASRRQRQASVA